LNQRENEEKEEKENKYFTFKICRLIDIQKTMEWDSNIQDIQYVRQKTRYGWANQALTCRKKYLKMYTFEAYIFWSDEKHGVDKTYKLLFLSPILWIKKLKKWASRAPLKKIWCIFYGLKN